jgi:spermidine synthase
MNGLLLNEDIIPSMRRYLLLTVFFSGMTTLAAELAASRLIGAVYGTSNIVWASIIGLILIYLTAGYFLGGWWADRNPSPPPMFRVIAWGAFTLGLVPYVASPVLKSAAHAFEGLQAGVLAGSFLGVLILFSIPITLLGTVSPFAIRLSISDPMDAGKISGRIYAISTLGSFLGTFLPTLYTIPALGTRLTFLIFSLLLLLIALTGLILTDSWRSAFKLFWMPLALIVLAIVARNLSIKESPGQLFESESAYNYIQVQEVNDFTVLRLNEGQGVHSIFQPDNIRYGGPWEQFLVGPFLYKHKLPQDVKSMAIIGLAAGTTARLAAIVYDGIQIDGFEIDEEIVAVGREYFALNIENLNVVIGDGRLNLELSTKNYDIIAVDAYRPPYIPPHMTTLEFFSIAKSHLTKNGTLTINAASVPGDRRLVNGLASTLSMLFPSVYTLDVPGSLNTMIYATVSPTSIDDFVKNLDRLKKVGSIHPLLIEVMSTATANLGDDYEKTEIFTDDRAPIEWIVNDMVLKFVFKGGLEYLQ